MSPEECRQPLARVSEGGECGRRRCTGGARGVPCDLGTRSCGDIDSPSCLPVGRRPRPLGYRYSSVSRRTFCLRCPCGDGGAGRSRRACEERGREEWRSA